MTGRISLIGLIACAFLATARADGPAKPIAPTPTAEDLVKDLGSPIFSVRDKATKALWQMGEKARPALEGGAKSLDEEVARRSQEILDKFDLGVFPDTPADVIGHIRSFRSGQLDKQKAAVVALVKLGEKGVPTLRSLLGKPIPSESRNQPGLEDRIDHRYALFDHLVWALRLEVPALVMDGKYDRAEALLSLHTLGPCSGGLMDYATFVQLRGRTREAIAALEAARKTGGPTGEAAAVALVYALRAAHEDERAKAAARAVADTVGEPDDSNTRMFGLVEPRNLYDSLLEDLGDWNTLADQDGPANSRDGLKIFRLRLAGRHKEADELTEAQKEDPIGTPGRGNFSSVDPATMALLLNDRPEDGIARLKAQLTAPHILADILTSRLQFQDALDLLTTDPKYDAAAGVNMSYLRTLYGTRKGRLLAMLGKRDAAAQVFAQVAEQLAQSNEYGLTQLVRAEVRSGRYDLACEHLGTGLVRFDPDNSRGANSRQDGYELLFGADADSAAWWFRTLRKARPGTDGGTNMRLVRALLTGRASPDDLDLALRAAQRNVPPAGTYEAEQRAMAVAAAYRAADQLDEAIATLSAAAGRPPGDDAATLSEMLDEGASARRYGRGSRWWVFGTDERFRFWMDLGDLLMEKGQFKTAAARYADGWRRFPDNPILLYLSGRALLQAGDEAEGKRRVETSHWAALGNARIRGRFLMELNERGHLADVRRERDLVRDTAWVSEPYIGNVWNQVTRASVLLKEFDAAASANRRAVHYVLRTPPWAYVEGYAYLTVPQAIKVQTARGLLAAGKVDEAVALTRECLAVMPGNNDLVIPVVAELDRIGRTKAADELFRQVWGTFRKLAEENPESGWAHHSAAWLAAGCRRELDAALEHARKAAELDPELRAHKEGLAEVHFRRGDRAKATELMRELVAVDRRSHHYRRQLERYQTAPFDSPLPEADD